MSDVSIVIPAYNAATTLAATLKSLAAQSMKDWEAIVVDDGSQDGTRAIAEQAATGDPRIRVLARPQGGASAARNTALAEAQGRWVLFLDADDRLAPDHLECLLAAAAEQPDAAVLHCGWRRVAHGTTWRNAFPAAPLDDAMLATARACPFAIHAALTRRDAITAAGGFDPTLRISEDWDLWQRIARMGGRFVPVEGHLADVHVQPGSLSSNSARHLADGLSVIRRGHAADPRLPADITHPLGAPDHDQPRAIWWFALWIAGAAIGRGEDPIALLDSVVTPIPPDLDAFALAAIVEDGMAVGIGPGGPPLYRAWSRVAPALDAVLARLGNKADQVRTALETMVARAVPVGESARIGGTAVLAIDPADRLTDIELVGIGRVRVNIVTGDTLVAAFDVPGFGALGGEQLLQEVRARADTADMRRHIVEALVRAGPLALGLPLRAALRGYARLVRSRFRPHIHRHAKLPHEDVIALLYRADPPGDAVRAAQGRVAAIVAEESRRILGPTGLPQTDDTGAEAWTPPDYTDPDYWESVFDRVDPWGYRNNYETVKYEQTLDLIRDVPIGRALEIACAEGEFSRRLAARAGHVLATDIAPTAVARAAAACADLDNCTFRQLDLLTDEPPGRYDLIVASEVLYYLEPDALRAFADKVARHLEPGGLFLTAHGNLLVDEPDRTGFGWPHHFGGKGIGEIFAAQGDLVLDTELWTPLYRIQRFSRRAADDAPPPQRIVADTARLLPERVAAQVKWRGGRDVSVTDDWHDFPILMYHRIAGDGPPALARYRTAPDRFEAQLAYMRDNDWKGVSFERMRQAVHLGWPLPIKSVMLTFDDATRDFLDHALPLLHRYGFPATVFVPTGHVGGAADWDAAYGAPAPLLGWDELRMLTHCDVHLGAHGVTHRPLTALPPETLVRELIDGRLTLSREIGNEVTSLAYPYGAFDDHVRDLAYRTGSRFGFTCLDGRVPHDTDPMMLRRREVRGDIDLDQFAELLEGR